MPVTIYYNMTGEEITKVALGDVASNPAPGSGEAKIGISDTDWGGTTGYHCPGGVYTRRDYIVLSTDAVDSVQPYDGIPDVPADGSSFATITAQKKNGVDASNNLTGMDTFYVEMVSGSAYISVVSVQLISGAASFTVKSTNTGRCKIRVYDPNNLISDSTIELQFRP